MATNPYNSAASNYWQTPAGVLVPKRLLQDSGSRQVAVTDNAYGSDFHTSLEQYARWQLSQSRYKYFVMDAVYQGDSWVRAAVDYITGSTTREPNRLIDRTDPLNPDIRDLTSFFATCHEDKDFHDLYEGVVQDMLVFGAAYQYVESRRRDGRPLYLHPLDSRITFPVFDFHGNILFFAQVYAGRVELFDKDEILYFPMPTLSGRQPVSKIETLYESVSMEAQANRYNAYLFENNLNIGAVFSIPSAEDEDIEDNIRLLEDQYARPENAGRTLILKNDAKLLRDGALLTKDINFVELFKTTRHRVCAVFGVPEALLGIPENANRSTTDTQERDTYVTTVQPLRRRVNRRYTSQFIVRRWGSPTVEMVEPLSAMLPTKGHLEAVNTAAEIGQVYNDLREMQGLPRVPNGDYFVKGTPNGYVRMDTMMPGLGDPHFDFVAYQLEHQSQMEADAQNAADSAASGLPPTPSSAPEYVPPRPQDQIQLEPIAARIVDISRSLRANEYDWDDFEDDQDLVELWTPMQVVSRRIPRFPGTRGGSFYQTKSGKVRYGRPPTAKQAPIDSKDGTPNQNTLTNPKDPNMPKRLSPEERLQMAAARSEVETLFRQAQEENWTNEQFMKNMEDQGWARAVETRDTFNDVRDARSEARRLSELYPDKAYVLLGADGQYFVMEKPLAGYRQGPKGVGGGKKGDRTATDPALNQ